MILYVNCCPRKASRTDRLARALLEKLGGEYQELRLYKENISALTEHTLTRRTKLLAAGDLSSPMFAYAKQFAEADQIVIAAPYWDLSFPAMLKVYIENIYVTGIVSRYGPDGRPEGLCRAEKLYYVTTAGGPYAPEYSFGYLKTMATQFFGIPQVELIAAQMLDVEGFCAEEILQRTILQIQTEEN